MDTGGFRHGLILGCAQVKELEAEVKGLKAQLQSRIAAETATQAEAASHREQNESLAADLEAAQTKTQWEAEEAVKLSAKAASLEAEVSDAKAQLAAAEERAAAAESTLKREGTLSSSQTAQEVILTTCPSSRDKGCWESRGELAPHSIAVVIARPLLAEQVAQLTEALETAKSGLVKEKERAARFIVDLKKRLEK